MNKFQFLIDNINDDHSLDHKGALKILRLLVSFSKASPKHSAIVRAVLKPSDHHHRNHHNTHNHNQQYQYQSQNQSQNQNTLAMIAQKIMDHMHEYNAIGLSSIAHAFGTLEVTPGNKFWSHWFKVIQAKPTNARSLSSAFWAMAKIEVSPPDWFLHTICDLLREQEGLRDDGERNRPATSFSAQEVSMCFWAFGKLHFHPPQPVLEAIYEMFADGPAMFSSQGMSNILWSLASLNAMPSHHFRNAYTAEFVRRHQTFSDQALANIIWACGRLGFPLDSEFLDCWEASYLSAAESTRIAPQCIANSLVGFAKGEFPISKSLGQAFLQMIWSSLEAFSSDEFSSVVWSAAKLKLDISEQLVIAFYGKFRAQAARYNPRHLATFIWSMSVFQEGLDQTDNSELATWLEEWLSQSCATMKYSSGVSLVVSLQGFAKLNWTTSSVNPLLTQDYMNAVEKRFLQLDSQDFDSKSFALIAWSLGKLSARGLKVSSKFWAQWWSIYEQKGDRFVSIDLLNVLWAVSKLKGSNIPNVFWKHIESALLDPEGVWKNISNAELCTIIHALGSLRKVPSEAFLLAWQTRFYKSTASYSSWMLSSALWGFARMRVRPSMRFLRRWNVEIRAEMSNASSQALACMAWAAAQFMLPRPSDALFEGWYLGVVKKQHAMSEEELIDTIWAMGRYRLDSEHPLWTIMLDQLVSRNPERFNGLHISNGLWAVSLCNRRGISAEQRDYLVRLTDQALVNSSGGDLCCMLHSLVRLHVDLPEPFLRRWSDALSPHVGKLTMREMTLALMAMGEMDQTMDRFTDLQESMTKRMEYLESVVVQQLAKEGVAARPYAKASSGSNNPSKPSPPSPHSGSGKLLSEDGCSGIAMASLPDIITRSKNLA